MTWNQITSIGNQRCRQRAPRFVSSYNNSLSVNNEEQLAEVIRCCDYVARRCLEYCNATASGAPNSRFTAPTVYFVALLDTDKVSCECGTKNLYNNSGKISFYNPISMWHTVSFVELVYIVRSIISNFEILVSV